MMTLCPVCSNALAHDGSLTRCPNCGASLAGAQGEGAAPPPLPPVADEVPPAGEAPHATAPSTPWEERERIGAVSALVDTTKLVLLSPSAFFRAMPVGGGIGAPLLYAVIVGWIGIVVASFYQAVFRSILGPGTSTFGERPELVAMVGFLQSWAGFAAQVVFGGVMVVIGVFVWAGLLHLVLLLLGGARRDFEATVRVVCYSQATSLLFVLPFCGSPIAFAWSLVLYVIGLAHAHGIGRGKAAAAVLGPLFLCCCCAALLAAMFTWALAGLAG
jgi:hypothetical protein